jgi:glycosyltransferase involved in cell wall biosynthesis
MLPEGTMVSNNAPLVSIIIPVYNGEKYLAEAIESVLVQTYRPVEIIVIDDGSTDESANIAKSFKDVRYSHQTNQGVSVARNVGLENARGEFIAFLDADDIWMFNKLYTQINYLLKNPHVCYTITNQRIIIEPGTSVPAFFNKELLQKDHAAFVPSSLVTRKVVFEQIGGFDTTYVNSGEDIEWFIRAKDAGMLMVVHEETLLHRRMHKSNISMHRRKNYPRLLRTLKKTIDRQANQLSAKEVQHNNGK